MARDPYFALAGLNWSRLKAMRESPLAFDYQLRNGFADALHFRLGRALHALALEHKEAFIVYAGERRGNSWKDFQKAHADEETILTQSEYDVVLDMHDALLKSEHFACLDGHKERVLTWTDKKTGLACKARVDDVNGSIRELKSTQHREPRRFAGDAARLGYANQLVWYEWAAIENGITMTDVHRMLVVTSSKPHDVWNLPFGPEAQGILESARQENRQLLDRYAECLATDTWPGACPGELDIGSIWPKWDTGGDDWGIDMEGL